MESLANLMPKVYADNDPDGSLAAFVAAYDQTHEEQIEVMETLEIIRIPENAPSEFIPNIADAMGSPFPFMTAARWAKGNKLNNLAYTYSLRGSQTGITDVIRYLVGVEVVVETDVEYEWILGVSRLPGPASPTTRITLRDSMTGKNYDLIVTDGEFQVVPSVFTTSVTAVYFTDTILSSSFTLTLVNGTLTPTEIALVPGTTTFLLFIDALSGINYRIQFTDGQMTIEPA